MYSRSSHTLSPLIFHAHSLINEHICAGQFLGPNLLWFSKPPKEKGIISILQMKLTSERLNDLPKVTELLRARIWINTKLGSIFIISNSEVFSVSRSLKLLTSLTPSTILLLNVEIRLTCSWGGKGIRIQQEEGVRRQELWTDSGMDYTVIKSWVYTVRKILFIRLMVLLIWNWTKWVPKTFVIGGHCCLSPWHEYHT